MQPSPTTTTTPDPTATAAGAKPPPARSRWPIIITGSAAAAGIVVAAVLILVMGRGTDAPRLNADTVALAKFVNSDRYAKLPFEKQSEYMMVLEDREDNGDLDAAFEDGRLTEAEFRAALQEAWLGEQLKRTEKYASMPTASAKAKYVNELLNKKEKKKAAKGKSGGGGGNKNDNDGDGGGDGGEIKRDKSTDDARLAAWPDDVRARWTEFRNAYDQAKEARRAETAAPDAPQRPQKKAATGARGGA